MKANAVILRYWTTRIVLTACLASLVGCHTDMYDQPRYEPLEASRFFDDGMASRSLVPGTIARGQLDADDALYTGREDGQPVQENPLEITPELLARGEQRFNIYCSVCHSRTGDGNGMIVRRGFRRPPSFHIDRLRSAPDGHFFDVITHGFGAMPSLAHQVRPEDRWAITAYLRALQLSQYANPDLLTPAEREQLSSQTQQ